MFMHFAFLHNIIRLFSSEHSFTSVDRGRKATLKPNHSSLFFFLSCDSLLPYQCRPCGIGLRYIHQSNRKCNLPQPAHIDHSRSHSVSRTLLLVNPQMPCMDLFNKNTTKCKIKSSNEMRLNVEKMWHCVI